MSKEIFYPLLLLLIPFIGNLFSSDVNWGVFDFIVMGCLLILFGTGLRLVSTKTRSSKTRILGICLLTLLFLAVWVELAVGFFHVVFQKLVQPSHRVDGTVLARITTNPPRNILRRCIFALDARFFLPPVRFTVSTVFCGTNVRTTSTQRSLSTKRSCRSVYHCLSK